MIYGLENYQESPHLAFDIDFKTPQMEIVTNCFVAGILSWKPDYTGGRYNAKAVWDTGATNTVVSTKIIKSLGLKPTGYCEVATADTKEHKKAHTYYVDIGLIDLKCGHTVIEVIEEDMKDDVLIGMDIIGLGDFAICNGRIFSYCCPPLPNALNLREKADRVNARKRSKRRT